MLLLLFWLLIASGPTMCTLLGAPEFLFLYLGACLTSAAAQRWVSPHASSLGASGGIYALLLSYGFSFPKATLSLYGVIPVPALLLVGGLVAFDLYNMRSSDGIGHAAHLGGAALGAVHWALRVRGRL